MTHVERPDRAICPPATRPVPENWPRVSRPPLDAGPSHFGLFRQALLRQHSISTPDAEQMHRDLRDYGICIMDEHGKRIDPESFYASPPAV